MGHDLTVARCTDGSLRKDAAHPFPVTRAEVRVLDGPDVFLDGLSDRLDRLVGELLLQVGGAELVETLGGHLQGVRDEMELAKDAALEPHCARHPELGEIPRLALAQLLVARTKVFRARG